MVAFQNGSLDAAERDLLQARRLAPDDPTILPPLIGVYQHAGRYDQALALIAAALPTAADKVTLLEERAQIDNQQHKPDLVLADTDAILRLAPNDLSAHYLRGLALRDKGDRDGAAQEWERVYTADPTFEQVATLLGQLWILQGRAEEGRRLLTLAARQNQDSALRLPDRRLPTHRKRILRLDSTICNMEKRPGPSSNSSACWNCGLRIRMRSAPCAQRSMRPDGIVVDPFSGL